MIYGCPENSNAERYSERRMSEELPYVVGLVRLSFERQMGNEL
jgi:hypothetical protein